MLEDVWSFLVDAERGLCPLLPQAQHQHPSEWEEISAFAGKIYESLQNYIRLSKCSRNSCRQRRRVRMKWWGQIFFLDCLVNCEFSGSTPDLSHPLAAFGGAVITLWSPWSQRWNRRLSTENLWQFIMILSKTQEQKNDGVILYSDYIRYCIDIWYYI